VKPQSSAADQVITALVSKIPGWLTAADVTAQVIDGPSTERLEKDAVVIGVGDPAVITSRSDPDLGGRCTETGEIVCVISCWDGERLMGPKRTRVYAILAAIETGLREDPTLVDSDGEHHADDSMIGSSGELTQRQANGALAALGFTIMYEAHI
jgi:hypothetical protein